MDASESVVIEADRLTRRYGRVAALDELTLRVGRGRVVGLVGRNGSGKSTLLRAVLGLDLPTGGSVRVLGTPTRDLGAAELERVGAVFQDVRFLPWMTGARHLAFVRSFQKRWDEDREQRLLDAFELDASSPIGAMSPGNVQKLAIVSAVCHHPELLLLDEPAAALDPIAREALLQMMLEIVAEDAPTVIVSSHALRDVERIADWIVCLEHGRVVVDAPFDEIQERHGRWVLTARERRLPDRFDEPWILAQRVDGPRAELLVRDPVESAESFATRHGAEVEARGLELERMFPLWIGSGRS